MLRSLVVLLLLGCAQAALAAEDQSTPPPSGSGTHQCERSKGEAKTS
jgi:hypothetical protein